MFIDLVDSTALSTRVEPETYRTLVSSYRTQAARFVEHYEGHLTSTKGDGLLAVFGHPRSHEDDTHRAVAAALDIARLVSQFSEQAEQRYGVRVEVRIGVHRGLVLPRHRRGRRLRVRGQLRLPHLGASPDPGGHGVRRAGRAGRRRVRTDRMPRRSGQGRSTPRSPTTGSSASDHNAPPAPSTPLIGQPGTQLAAASLGCRVRRATDGAAVAFRGEVPASARHGWSGP